MSKKHDTENPKTFQPSFLSRRRILLGLGAIAAIGGGAALLLRPTPSMAEEVVVFKDPSCACCDGWVRHMRAAGFKVSVNAVDDMSPIKVKAGIPDAMQSCHTAFIGPYVAEGHVPAADIKRMLAEGPAIKGLAVPGMPSSAPGMDGPAEPFAVLAFDAKGKATLFASH